MSDKLKAAIKWGVIGGIGSACLGLVFFLVNVDTSSFLNYLSFAILIAVIIFGSYEFRDKIKGGFASFKELFGFAITITLIYALIGAIWNVLYIEVIDTNLLSEILLKTELDMEEKGLEPEIIQQTLMVTKKMMQPAIFFLTSLLMMILLGTLASLFSSTTLKKEKPESIKIDEKLEQE